MLYIFYIKYLTKFYLKKMYFNLIAACDSKNGIGLNGSIPWLIKEDLKHFKDITSSVPEDRYYNNINIVVMGRKTWDSLPTKYKPLPNRINVIITTKKPEEIEHHENNMVYIISEFDQIYDIINTNLFNKFIKSGTKPYKINEIYVIGGQSIYENAIKSPYCRMIYLTEIYKNYNCDTYFPKFPVITHKILDTNNSKIKDSGDQGCEDEKMIVDGFDLTEVSEMKYDQEQSVYYRFLTYYHPARTQNIKPWKNLSEESYLEVMENILCNGINRIDRTLVGTHFLPGVCLKYDLKTFPISTTKKIALRWIFEELKLYLSGKTDTNILKEQGINIWDGNTSRDFLDKRGLGHLPEGDMGETYGFNFRHFGGEYKDCHTEYDSTVGYDQVANVVNLLKNDPTSRRIIINLWNPATQHKAALPSCLFYYQFSVDPEKKELHCIIHLRSSDYFLANNWNTCTGSLLTYMLCNLEGIDLTPGTLTVFVSDAHIYKSHFNQVRQNLLRKPYPYPILRVKEKKQSLNDFNFKDFELIGYKSHNSIKAEMAI